MTLFMAMIHALSLEDWMLIAALLAIWTAAVAFMSYGMGRDCERWRQERERRSFGF